MFRVSVEITLANRGTHHAHCLRLHAGVSLELCRAARPPIFLSSREWHTLLHFLGDAKNVHGPESAQRVSPYPRQELSSKAHG